MLLWTAGYDRVAGDARGHCARRFERALDAEYARSLAPCAEPPPALQFHVWDEADDADDGVVVLVRAGLGRGLGVVYCVVGFVALLRDCCKKVVGGSMVKGWAGLAARGLVAVAVVLPVAGPSRRCRRRVSPAIVVALAAALVTALVVERTLLVDAAAPFGFVLSNVVPFFCVDSCPGKRVGNNVSR